MLNLTRKSGQRIWIGDICVAVEKVPRSNNIRVSIAAPRDIVITREELLPPSDPRRQMYKPAEAKPQ